jgi:hypothetical protein
MGHLVVADVGQQGQFVLGGVARRALHHDRVERRLELLQCVRVVEHGGIAGAERDVIVRRACVAGLRDVLAVVVARDRGHRDGEPRPLEELPPARSLREPAHEVERVGRLV